MEERGELDAGGFVAGAAEREGLGGVQRLEQANQVGGAGGPGRGVLRVDDDELSGDEAEGEVCEAGREVREPGREVVEVVLRGRFPEEGVVDVDGGEGEGPEREVEFFDGAEEDARRPEREGWGVGDVFVQALCFSQFGEAEALVFRVCDAFDAFDEDKGVHQQSCDTEVLLLRTSFKKSTYPHESGVPSLLALLVRDDPFYQDIP